MFGFGKKNDELQTLQEDANRLIGTTSSVMAHSIELMNPDYYETVRRKEVNFIQILEHLTECSGQTGKELEQLREDNHKLQQALEILSEDTSNNFLEK